MSETARTWLNSLTSLYTPTSTQFDAAKSHRASIESRLDAAIGIYRMFEIGSLRHGTGIWQYSEVFSPESHRRQQRHPNGVA